MNELDLSIIIPTYNRHNFLIRTLKYWANKKIIIHVLDGSMKPLAKDILISLSNNINYHHLPIGLLERISYSQNIIKTKYVALLSDDEFYLTSSLKKFISILEINKDLACCSGVTLAYNYDKNKKEVNGFYLYTYPPFNECKKLNLMQNNPFERLKYHMENYIPIATYNVTRSEYFKKIVNLIGLKEYKAYASWEIQFEIAMSLFGKIKFIPVIYWIRGWEVSAIRNTSPSMTILNSADDWWNNEMNKNEKDQFSKDLLNLIFSESKDFNKSKINFINIMNKYFEKKIKKNKKKVVFSFSFFRIFKVFVPSFLLDKITNRSLVGKIKNLKKYNLSVDEKEVNEIVRLIKKNPINEF